MIEQNEQIEVQNKDLLTMAAKEERKCTTDLFRQNSQQIGKMLKRMMFASRKTMRKEIKYYEN